MIGFEDKRDQRQLESAARSASPEKKRAMSWLERQAGRPLTARDKVIGVVLLIVFLFVFYIVLDANKYRMMLQVIEGEGKVGVNPTSESLDFGDMSRGTQAIRRVDIKNGTFMPVYVAIFKTGPLSELVKLSSEDADKASGNFFTLLAGREVKIDFLANVPASAQVGKNYTGRVYLFKIPTFWLTGH